VEQVVKNAKVLAEELMKYGFNLATGGTDNHLMLIDLRNKGVSGREFAINLEESGIIVNYNAIPGDTNPPMNPSGIRLGTPALTTRGMKEKEMTMIAGWINRVSNGSTSGVKKEIEELCKKFPVL
jgi:glycine hydroxymethyltransferase